MLNYASERDIPVLKAIWKSRFGDSDRYIDSYFDALFPLIRIPVYRLSDGTPASMLSMLPVSLRAGESRFDGHYIYAAATASEQEGHGLMSALLDFACEEAEKAGQAFSALLPASEALARFYRKRGYRPLFYREVVHYPPYLDGADAVKPSFRPLSLDEFTAVRNRFLTSLPETLVQDASLYPYLYSEAVDSGMEPLLAEWEGKRGYLLCAPEQDMLLIKESSIPRAVLERMVGALKHRYRCSEMLVSYPARRMGGSVRPYGMIRFLKEEIPISGPAYMGLLMD